MMKRGAIFFAAVLLLQPPKALHGFVARAPTPCAQGAGPRAGVGRRGARCPGVLCALRPAAQEPPPPPPLLAMPFCELCELVGERDARSAWNSYRIGLDPAAGEAAQSSRKLQVSAAGLKILRRSPLSPRTDGVLVSADGTLKLLIRLADGLAVETVLIPPLEPEQAQARSSRAKTSLCVSSQVGCMRGCRFCSTGTMGIVRNLHAEEILATIILSRKEAAARGLPSVDNIVFMGMGEPLDNPDALAKAVEALVDGDRFGFAKSKVLVSTVGPSPEALETLAPLDCQIAWSVHAADDGTRRLLVPSTRHSMLELRGSVERVLAARKARGGFHSIMVEYVLLQGVNDSREQARELAAFLLPLHDVTRDEAKPHRKRTGLLVNIIPFNEGAEAGDAGGLNGFKRPSQETVQSFQWLLRLVSLTSPSVKPGRRNYATLVFGRLCACNGATIRARHAVCLPPTGRSIGDGGYTMGEDLPG